MVMERLKTMKIGRNCLAEVEAAVERYGDEVEGTRLARSTRTCCTRRTSCGGCGTTSSRMGSGVDER